jgi:hypothetical protein
MPAPKKASQKKKPQATGKAKADAQNTAQEEKKTISGASTRIFGKTQKEAEAAINKMHDDLATALEIARARSLANASDWDATNHEQGAEIAIPLLTILRSLSANNLEAGNKAGQRESHKHFLNAQAITDAIQNSTGGAIDKGHLNDLISIEAKEQHVLDLHNTQIWEKRQKKNS